MQPVYHRSTVSSDAVFVCMYQSDLEITGPPAVVPRRRAGNIYVGQRGSVNNTNKQKKKSNKKRAALPKHVTDPNLRLIKILVNNSYPGRQQRGSSNINDHLSPKQYLIIPKMDRDQERGLGSPSRSMCWGNRRCNSCQRRPTVSRRGGGRGALRPYGAKVVISSRNKVIKCNIRKNFL